MSLENPILHLLWFAHPFRPFVSLPVVLTPPLIGWLCPKGQVTRAQEAEENYLVKRELATVKQQSEEAGAQLEQAKKTIKQLQQQQQPQGVRRATDSLRQAGCTGSSGWPECDWSCDTETGVLPRSVCDVQYVQPQDDYFNIIIRCATNYFWACKHCKQLILDTWWGICNGRAGLFSL